MEREGDAVMSKKALREEEGERRTREARFEFAAASRAQFYLFGFSVFCGGLC